MSNDTNTSSEVSNNLYDKNPDTGKIDTVFTAVAERDPEIERAGDAGKVSAGTSTAGTAGTASEGASGSNSIVAETEIGIIGSDGIQKNGCVVMQVVNCMDKDKYENDKKQIKAKAKASERTIEAKGRE